jgi:hypothetical protein
MTGMYWNLPFPGGGLIGDFRPILLKNPVSASSEKFLAAMRGFVISDMRGHK